MEVLIAALATTPPTVPLVQQGGEHKSHKSRRRSLDKPDVVPLATDDTLRHPSWDVVFEGPAETPYYGGFFLLRAVFSPEYPCVKPLLARRALCLRGCGVV